MFQKLEILKNLILKILIILLLISGILYYYLTHKWANYYSTSEVKEYVSLINASPSLSPNFYGIYDKLHSGRTYSNNRIYLSAIVEMVKRNRKYYMRSSFLKAAELLPLKIELNGYSSFYLSWGLEKYTSASKCFDFAINQENKELLKMSSNEYTKPIYKLSDTVEILKYLIVSKNPHSFIKNNQLLDKMVKENYYELLSNK